MVLLAYNVPASSVVLISALLVRSSFGESFAMRASPFALQDERSSSTSAPALPVDDLPSLLSLVAALEAKDAYTSKHGDRVADWAAQVGDALGLGTQRVERLRNMALVHDVGKIGVSEEILNKPGKLTPSEWRKMASHPLVGARIIQEALPQLIPGVLHHHEAWDGSGYPSGLVGEGIPLEARVLAVVDSFDAMTSDRAYRRGMSWAAAREILLAGRGGQWDARLVDLFLGLV